MDECTYFQLKTIAELIPVALLAERRKAIYRRKEEKLGEVVVKNANAQ